MTTRSQPRPKDDKRDFRPPAVEVETAETVDGLPTEDLFTPYRDVCNVCNIRAMPRPAVIIFDVSETLLEQTPLETTVGEDRMSFGEENTPHEDNQH